MVAEKLKAKSISVCWNLWQPRCWPRVWQDIRDQNLSLAPSEM